MESHSNANDVQTLLSRAGLSGRGAYREFSSKQAQAASSSTESPKEIREAVEPAATPGYVISDALHGRSSSPIDALLWSDGKESQEVGPLSRIALFSLAGGVGKTTVAAGLARTLCGMRRRVAIANCAGSFGFQHLCGPDAHSIGMLTFVHLDGDAAGNPLILVEAPEFGLGSDRDAALRLIKDSGHLNANYVFLDLPANRSAHTLECLQMADHIVIPVNPDMHSMLTVRWVQDLLGSVSQTQGRVHYLLNRYEPKRELHREMRSRFQEVLGGALLPFWIGEEPNVQDAMRCGMTIVDFAPKSEIASDFRTLGAWACQLLPTSAVVKGISA